MRPRTTERRYPTAAAADDRSCAVRIASHYYVLATEPYVSARSTCPARDQSRVVAPEPHARACWSSTKYACYLLKWKVTSMRRSFPICHSKSENTFPKEEGTLRLPSNLCQNCLTSEVQISAVYGDIHQDRQPVTGDRRPAATGNQGPVTGNQWRPETNNQRLVTGDQRRLATSDR